MDYRYQFTYFFDIENSFIYILIFAPDIQKHEQHILAITKYFTNHIFYFFQQIIFLLLRIHNNSHKIFFNRCHNKIYFSNNNIHHNSRHLICLSPNNNNNHMVLINPYNHKLCHGIKDRLALQIYSSRNHKAKLWLKLKQVLNHLGPIELVLNCLSLITCPLKVSTIKSIAIPLLLSIKMNLKDW